MFCGLLLSLRPWAHAADAVGGTAAATALVDGKLCLGVGVAWCMVVCALV